MNTFKIKEFLFSMAAICLLQSVHAQSNPLGWTKPTYVNFYKEGTFVQNGLASLKVQVLLTNPVYPSFLSSEIPVTPGDSYNFSYYYETPYEINIAEVLVWTGLEEKHQGGFRWGSGDMLYSQASLTGTVPAGATGVRVGFLFTDCLYLEPCSYNPTIHFGYLDNMSFESPAGSGNRLFNGNFENWGNRNWAEILNTSPSGATHYYSVAISGDYAVIGDALETTDASGSNPLYYAGAAYILYKNQGGTDNWGMVKKIVPGDRHQDDYFGANVDIYSYSGTHIVVVGANLNDYDASGSNYLSAAGAAYVFSKDQGGTNNWGQVKKIVAADRHAGDYFGSTLSVVYTSVAIGATGNDYDAGGLNFMSSAGAAYIFERSQGGANNWGQVKKIVPAYRYAGDEFGNSVALSGGYSVAVGAYGHDYDAAEANWMDASGAVYVFQKDQGGTNNWGMEKKIVPEHRYSGDLFGNVVAMYGGSEVLVGAHTHDYDLSEDNYIENAGAAFLFNRDQGGVGNWGQVKKFISPARSTYNYFGNFISLGGDFCAIAESEYNRIGATHVFCRYEEGKEKWGHINTLTASIPVIDSHFGNRIDLSESSYYGSNILVGAYGYSYLLRNILPAGIKGFSDIKENKFTVKWTDGDGTAYTVFIKEGDSGNALPVKNTTYTSNTDFGDGSQVGSSGWYCLYNGTGNSVTVTGLNPATTYRTMVISYTGITGSEIYNLCEGYNNPANQTTGIDLSGVSIHIANGQITGTTTAMEYSLNSQDGSGGSWFDCTDLNTSVIFTEGKVYVRQKLIPSNFLLVATISTAPEAPAYTINYPYEKTNEIIPVTVEYNNDNNFATPNSHGSGTAISLLPGTDLYFRVQATATTLPGQVFHLNIPARPAAPTYYIDFKLETTAEIINTTDQYSYNVDMSNAVTGTGLKILLNPGQNIYFRMKATVTSFSGNIQVLAVPSRPDVPVVSLTDKNSSAAVFVKSSDGTGAPVGVPDGMEFSQNFGISWDAITPLTKIDATGMNYIMVRKMSTVVSFASEATGNLDFEKPLVTIIDIKSCNGPADNVAVQSNIDNGKVYLVLEGEPQSNFSDLETAIISGKGSSGEVSTAFSNLNISSTGLVPGTYYVYATNDWDSISDINATTVDVYGIPEVDLGEDIVKCKNTEVTLDAGQGYSTYFWPDNGSSTQTITVTEENNWVVRVSDENGCINYDTISVRHNIPYQEQGICIVTIDLATGKNIIVWEKPAEGISAYKLYRETTIGVYESIVSIDPSALSIYRDMDVDPENQAYRYKIAIIDSCGVESELTTSKYHEPLFLQYVSSEEGINLEWTDYIIEGTTSIDQYLTDYVIYRGTDSTSLTEYWTMGSTTKFTDTDPDAFARKYYYRVAAVLKDPCYPAAGKKADSGPYSQSMSNIEDNRFQTGINDLYVHPLNIYPNPFSESTTIYFQNQSNSRYRLIIRDITGKVVVNRKEITGEEILFQRGILDAGIYYIELAGEKIFTGRMVIQ